MTSVKATSQICYFIIVLNSLTFLMHDTQFYCSKVFMCMLFGLERTFLTLEQGVWSHLDRGGARNSLMQRQAFLMGGKPGVQGPYPFIICLFEGQKHFSQE